MTGESTTASACNVLSCFINCLIIDCKLELAFQPTRPRNSPFSGGKISVFNDFIKRKKMDFACKRLFIGSFVVVRNLE